MHWNSLYAVVAVSHGLAALAFLVLSMFLLRRWRHQAHAAQLRLACLATVAWALSVIAGWLPNLMETLRTASWLVLLCALAGSGLRRRERLLVLVVALAAGAAVSWPEAATIVRPVVGLVLAVLGMLMVEQVYRGARQNARWGIKFACLGIGALFAYDFFLYSDALLFHRLDEDIRAARGVVNALTAPLLALALARSPAWEPQFQLSRQVMLGSVALAGSALYLLAMAASAWVLRSVGGAWGPLMQLACLCGAALLLAAVLFSGTMRARARIFIGKHFYKGRYDYRDEWQRATRALAAERDELPQRAIQAVARLVESPAGLLWLHGDDDSYRPTARWNTPLPDAAEPASGGLCALLSARGWVIEVPEWRQYPERYCGLALPEWLHASDLWLLVPLMLERRLFGFICLATPRTAFRLNWEVRDVLKIAASQAASYLAHRASADSLAIARQFESYNRMSTFIVHDLKNLVAQLSLLLANAERHRANPAFQEDMLATLSHSLDKMRHMLLKLRRDGKQEGAAALRLDLLLASAVQSKSACEPRPSLELLTEGVTVLADRQRLERVVGHLIQNAIEATPRTGQVTVKLRESGGIAVVELVDTGHGMSEQFMREHLFQPFVSTKAAGMGIGVFESREYLREIGGTLEVRSAPSQGSTFRLTLPLHKEIYHGQE